MPDVEPGTRKRNYAVIGFVIGFIVATTAVLTIPAAFRPKIAAQQPVVHVARAPRLGASDIPSSANQDAFSALHPTEMLHGCFECPLSSYLGKP
jgi:hypothetical protein